MGIEYSNEFYLRRNDTTVYAAEQILSIVLEESPEIQSAIDLGCGVGTWLSTLRQKGVKSVFGMDGPWVDQSLLQIDKEDFQVADLSATIPIENQYDLAISLEVAEHLPPESAEGFVDALTNAAEIVLFSAAVPDQGGVNHLNEQWQSYWAGLFQNKGYVPLDFVRARIWDDRKIAFWYKQNILLYVKESRVAEFRESVQSSNMPLSTVHPEMAVSLTSKETPKPSFNQCAVIMRDKMISRVKRAVGAK